jgi:glycosyltransferase involved in cell wall biosynthesis
MAVFLGKLFRRPSIVSLHGGEAAAVPSIGYGNMLQPWSRALTLMSCRQASVVVALSHFQADAMRCSGLQRADVRVVPYGADEKLFTFSRRALSPPFRFLHVANLTAVKDQQTLITVFDRVQREVPATLQIISADYLDGTLQQLVKRRGLNDCVSFSGFVPYQDLPAHYPQTHFLLHTSLYEDQGVVTLEASFSGVLVCGTRTGIHPDWQGNGFITVDVGEDEVLANAIIRVIGQPESYAALIDRTRRTAGSYRRSWTAQRYFEIYRNP